MASKSKVQLKVEAYLEDVEKQIADIDKSITALADERVTLERIVGEINGILTEDEEEEEPSPSVEVAEAVGRLAADRYMEDA